MRRPNAPVTTAAHVASIQNRPSYAFVVFFLLDLGFVLFGLSSAIKIEDKNSSLRDSTTFGV
jgi:hypothetical protein